MQCTYPEGEPNEWCEQHRRDFAMVVALGARR